MHISKSTSVKLLWMNLCQNHSEGLRYIQLKLPQFTARQEDPGGAVEGFSCAPCRVLFTHSLYTPFCVAQRCSGLAVTSYKKRCSILMLGYNNYQSGQLVSISPPSLSLCLCPTFSVIHCHLSPCFTSSLSH